MRMLNTGKGPAVRALRAQADKVLYQQEMKRVIEDEENFAYNARYGRRTYYRR